LFILKMSGLGIDLKSSSEAQLAARLTGTDQKVVGTCKKCGYRKWHACFATASLIWVLAWHKFSKILGHRQQVAPDSELADPQDPASVPHPSGKSAWELYFCAVA
jgi:hypothetical protein